MARYLESHIFIYINYLPPVIIHLPRFVNHLEIVLKVLLKEKSNYYYCTKFVIAPVKVFRLVREMQEYTTEFKK